MNRLIIVVDQRSNDQLSKYNKYAKYYLSNTSKEYNEQVCAAPKAEKV